MFSVQCCGKSVAACYYCVTIENDWLRKQVVNRLKKAGCRPVVWGQKITYGNSKTHQRCYHIVSDMLTDCEYVNCDIHISCLSLI